MPSSPRFRPSSPFRWRASSPDTTSQKENEPQPLKSEIGFGQRWTPQQRPALSLTGKPEDGARRQSSIQFNTSLAEDTIRRESLTPKVSILSNPSITSRRMSSPPPPRTYQRGVSFDTFDNRDATDFSLTLNYKHKDYRSSRRSRTFLCGTDQKDYSEFALEWLIDELVDDGDEIVCLCVVEKDSKIASDVSIEQGRYREKAQELLDQVIEKNSHEEKAISLIMELAVGRVQDVFRRMIQIYEPSVLIVGTRGRSLGGVQGLLPGSVSKWCLQSSPIPVIVVRPETKRLKKKRKLAAQPRPKYNTILEQTYGSVRVPEKDRQNSALPSATDDEAAAVAKAIGVDKDLAKPARHPGILKRRTPKKSETLDEEDEEEESSPEISPDGEPAAGFLPAGYMRTLAPVALESALKSDLFQALDETDDDYATEEHNDGKLSPERAKTTSGSMSEESELSHPKREHSASFSEDPPWLKKILNKPENRGGRRASAGRRPSSPFA